jgi:hypothetical protein
MARVPTRVSATSGQGVSRRSYQVARSLGAKGSGAPGLAPLRSDVESAKTGTGKGSRREYPKLDVSAEYTEREMANPDLASLKGFLAGATSTRRRPKGFL